MDFGRYLLFKGLLTGDEYARLLSLQYLRGIKIVKDTLLEKIDDLPAIRTIPFGEVLRKSAFADTVFNRARNSLDNLKSLDDLKLLNVLIDGWFEWHRGRLEPICSYSTGCKYGREIYVRQEEKKYVAQFLVAQVLPNGATIIQHNDRIIITEGTSGLYAGLAVAEAAYNAEVVTSDDGLIREYRDNPAVACRFRRFGIVGGEADYDVRLGRSEHHGVSGPMCTELKQVLTMPPPATVVIVTVGFLSAQAGPFTHGPSASLKHEIIKEALQIGVREIVFVADYTKHIHHADQTQGNKIFRDDEWQSIVANNHKRIQIVTSPPPALRNLLLSGQGRDVRSRKRLADFSTPPIPFTDEDYAYNTVACELQDLVGGEMVRNKFQSRFNEAYQNILPTFPKV